MLGYQLTAEYLFYDSIPAKSLISDKLQTCVTVTEDNQERTECRIHQ